MNWPLRISKFSAFIAFILFVLYWRDPVEHGPAADLRLRRGKAAPSGRAIERKQPASGRLVYAEPHHPRFYFYGVGHLLRKKWPALFPLGVAVSLAILAEGAWEVIGKFAY